jgi:precorrin-6B methylase 2
VVLPVARPARPAPTPTQPPSGERVFAKRVAPPSSRRTWPLVVGSAAGVLVLGGLVTVVVVVTAKSAGKSNQPPASSTADNRANAERQALEKAKAPPLSPSTIDRMLKLAKPEKQERLVDLGCGNGQLAVRAAQQGLIVNAFDTDPALVKMTKRLIEDNFLNSEVIGADQVKDVLEVDLSHADIIVIAHPERWGQGAVVGGKLTQRLEKLKDGVRLVTTQPILHPVQSSGGEANFTPPDDPGKRYTIYVYKTPLGSEEP